MAKGIVEAFPDLADNAGCIWVSTTLDYFALMVLLAIKYFIKLCFFSNRGITWL